MNVISKKNVLELQRIIKEATGRKVSLGEAYAISGYLIKILKLLSTNEDRESAAATKQQRLFKI